MGNYRLMKVMQYFTPPAHYFWQWADKGKVIEWINGLGTICYRDELVDILVKMADDEGMPPLGCVLLALSACKHHFNKGNILFGLYNAVNAEVKDKDRAEQLKHNVYMAVQLLDTIASLGAEYRTGDKRVRLLQVIFANEIIHSPAHSQAIMYEFRSGSTSNLSFDPWQESYSYADIFYEEMHHMANAASLYPTISSLELKLRTGLSSIPLPIPEIALPEEKPATDLLDQLSQDEKTSGLASLTRRLIAALNIPMHAHGQSDQSFGGVSDISNRGNFDRLLLSELAHDDLSLMARLANNEALYLRREELPDDLNRERVILIDTTLKMWGRPRVFAIATALACTRNNKLNATIHAYALGGKQAIAADLSSKEGIVKVLSQLDAGLDCGKALSVAMKNARGNEGDEYFLVTEESNIHTEAFHKAVAELKNPLSFLLTVDREGQLQFYEFIKGRRKLLSTAKFDLDAILNEKGPAAKEQRHTGNLPAFFNQDRSPLYFPTSKVTFNDTRIARVGNSVIAVTTDYRVLLWKERNKGAMELMEHIERGWYCFGSSGNDDIYIMCYHNGTGKNPIVHHINTSRETIRSQAMHGNWDNIDDAEFDDDRFHIKVKNDYHLVDPGTVAISPTDIPMRAPIHRPGMNMNAIKKFVNNGYTVINTVRNMHVNALGGLTVGPRYFSVDDHLGIRLLHAHKNYDILSPRVSPYTSGYVSTGYANRHVKFFRFQWRDGSEALFDSRGLLHLRSSDTSIPEVTIVLIMEKPLACWASNGDFCGAKYFTSAPVVHRPERDIAATTFYDQYIQPFIELLK